MLPRHEQILNKLATEHHVTVGHLSSLLNVSKVTIRNDLNHLAETGRVLRTHGGARLLEERFRLEYTFQVRQNLNADDKQKIGKLAASLVNNRESIIIDSSTTAVAMAQALRKRKNLEDVTVIPTGLWTALELMSSQNIYILMPGGYLRHTTGSIIGIQNGVFFNNLNIQKAYLGAAGISTTLGATDNNMLEVELKRFIVKNVQEVIVLVDNSKFSQTGLATWAEPSKISQIITDDKIPDEEYKRFQKSGVNVLVAE